MKRKRIEKLEPIPTKKKGLVATVQEMGEILILNIYKDEILMSRYCMNTVSGEYETFSAKEGKWSQRKLISACGYEALYTGTWTIREKLKFNSAEEEKIALEKTLERGGSWSSSAAVRIDNIEDFYNRNRREIRENNRRDRVKRIMESIPPMPVGMKKWIWEMTGACDYAFYDKKKDIWNCTCCGKTLPGKLVKRADGEKKVRHNDMVQCNCCGKIIQAKRRAGKIEKKEHFMILQPVCDKYSVARHFSAYLYWKGTARDIEYEEDIRIILFKMAGNPKLACDIYYDQYDGFDNKSNPWSRRTFTGFLFEDGIEEALEDTWFSAWSRLFVQMAAARQKIQWNRLMCIKKDEKTVRMVECLFKGRFYKLLRETSERVTYWGWGYWGPLNIKGETIEEVFGISDRQKINRIRDVDGGESVLYWMRWSDKSKAKISQETLTWLVQNNVSIEDVRFVLDRMNPQQIMNYINRQQQEGYKGKTVKQILEQWKDYLSMCERLNKKLDEEMIYRPRELKKRHDEAVACIAEHEAKITADEYSRRFPGVEDVLREIKEKFEYSNEKYVIIVPQRCADIVVEGRCLHHCAGSSDRYFDRIKQQETYICFLRKVAEPKTPYYTIEIEPGGTIRQHRGMFDEEPEIEKIKPFLREWQKEIKKRLTSEDKKLARISAVKREENLEELREKNNTRVLEGLMEDFMEAI